MDYVILVLKLLSLLIAAFLTVAMADLRLKNKSKLSHFFKSEKWIARGIIMALVFAVVVELFSFAIDKQVAEEATRLAEQTANNAGDAANRAGEAIEGISDVLQEVLRTAEPIESIELSIAFSLPLSHPYFSEYAVALKKKMGRPDRRQAQLRNKDRDTGFCGWQLGGMPNTRTGIEWMRSTHPLHPFGTQYSSQGSLAISYLEVSFFRNPVDPTKFVFPRRPGVFSTAPPPTRLPADLEISDSGLRADQWLLKRDVRTPDVFQMELKDWSVPSNEWVRSNVDIHFAGDLPGSQLLVDIGNIGDPDVRKAFDIASIDLRIDGKPIEIANEDLTKYTNQGGYPVWEFRFPDVYHDMFRHGARPLGFQCSYVIGPKADSSET